MFRDRRGQVLERSPRPSPLLPDAPERLVQSNADAGLVIDDQTGLCRWDGTRPDYSYCVEVITSREPTGRKTPPGEAA